MLEDYSHVNTKRQVVSLFSSIYDPIGLISPVTILSKLFIQKPWMMDQSWDSRFSEELIHELDAILKKYKGLENIKAPRNAHQGRSHLSDAPPESGYKDPILIESHCALWRLIVEHWHEVLLHCNTSTLLVHLRKEFWVPRMRQKVKKILKRCINYKRVQEQPYPTPLLAPVHPNHLNAEVPFRVTGLDYTVGFKVHRSHVDMVYVLLFTCAATRAVALETTTSLTVVELVQAMRSFAARFVMPQCLVSDNVSTFKAVQLADLTDPAFRERDILRKDYQKLTNMLQTFLKRSKYDYVSSLQERYQKSSCLHPNIPRVGDLCLLILDEVNREEYPLTRILEVYPGRDGHIRTVKVRSANGEYVRPVNRLIPLQVNENGQTLPKPSEEEPPNTPPLENLDQPPRDQMAERNVGTTADAMSPVVIAAPRHERPTRASAKRARALFQEIL
ncbi:uncharacterized protein [Palaemon carinicauda]|uniref:uncharacterized protein n=1 Tax=Palaemon carinicauda TaxID=392227 RepID=UPI0035B5B2A4